MYEQENPSMRVKFLERDVRHLTDERDNMGKLCDELEQEKTKLKEEIDGLKWQHKQLQRDNQFLRNLLGR